MSGSRPACGNAHDPVVRTVSAEDLDTLGPENGPCPDPDPDPDTPPED